MSLMYAIYMSSSPGYLMCEQIRRRAHGRRAWLLPTVLLISACADFAMAPDRLPESLSIEPADTLIRQGDRVTLRVTVLDQDGEPFPPVPSWAPPRWTFSEPDAVVVAPDGRLEGVGGGQVLARARLAGLSAHTTLRVNPNMVVLSAPSIYLVQSVQNRRGDVPLVAGTQALLRVFVTSEPASFYQPRGRATFYLADEEVFSVVLMPESALLPDDVVEGSLGRSYNALVPGSVVQPGVEMVVELDLDAVVPLAPGSQLRIPAEGREALDVRVLPSLDLTVVPVLVASAPDPSVHDWIDDMTPAGETLRYTTAVIPIGDLDLQVRETYTTTSDLTTSEGWGAFLREIAALQVADGSDRHYYGAVVLPAGSRWGGMGYIGWPASVGAPRTSTFAHELGHNFSLRHAPCGDAGGPDPNYPYDGGSAGVWGFEWRAGGGMGWLKDPDDFKDLMGYCHPKWISDYHFTKAFEFRMEPPGELAPAAAGSPQQTLLLWGSTGEGEMLIEPAFVVDAPPRLPAEDGPYRLEGFNDGGGVVFSLSFAPMQVAVGGEHFAFAVPVGAEEIEALDAITLSGPAGTVTVDRSGARPGLAMATDGATGRIRAILRDGVVPAAVSEGATVVFSRGLPDRGDGRRRE